MSEKYAKFAVESGAVVIDNTSHFRMEKDVPLVVPECNPEDIKDWKKTGIIANPNCSTIQMVQVLKPLNDAFNLKRVDVSTYQAASGAGKEGMQELVEAMQSFLLLNLMSLNLKLFLILWHLILFRKLMFLWIMITLKKNLKWLMKLKKFYIKI